MNEYNNDEVRVERVKCVFKHQDLQMFGLTQINQIWGVGRGSETQFQVGLVKI